MPPTERRPKAWGYARVSSPRQVDSGLSLESQEQRIHEYVQYKLGATHDYAGTYREEGESAYEKRFFDRPVGWTLHSTMERGDVIIITRINRAFRRTADAIATADEWHAKGVSLHILDLGGATIDFSTAIGHFILVVMAEVAQLDSYEKGQQTSAAIKVFLERGGLYGYRPPFGWKYVQNEDGSITAEEDLQLRERCATIVKLQREGMQYRDIAAWMNSHQLLRPKYKKVNPLRGTGHSGAPNVNARKDLVEIKKEWTPWSLSGIQRAIEYYGEGLEVSAHPNRPAPVPLTDAEIRGEKPNPDTRTDEEKLRDWEAHAATRRPPKGWFVHVIERQRAKVEAMKKQQQNGEAQQP